MTPLNDALVDMIGELFDERATSAPRTLPLERQLQLAGAALMICVVRADHSSTHDEHRVLENAVARTLGVDPDQAARMVRVAEDRLGADVPFHRFVELLDRGCTIEEKKSVVEALWRIAYADAELQATEEYVVRKVAEQLHLSTADLIETKVRARETFLAEDI
jgi:uncharacterized tellurite resistance protein B-like protein